MTFLISAWDGTDPQALERRMAARPAHLAGLEEGRVRGRIRHALAMLDDDGRMIGSTVVCEFDTREELDAWVRQEPYVTGGVWQRIEITPCRVAPGF